jgi:hypothetical protein
MPGKGLEWRPRYRLFLPVILLALFGIALHALVDFPFQIASLQLYAAVYLGICWGTSRWEGTVVTMKRKKRKIESGKQALAQKISTPLQKYPQPIKRDSASSAPAAAEPC